jgi:hypothetical protein
VTTSSSLRPGNATRVQDDPLRSQAVGPETPLKAHPPVLPTATTAVKMPVVPLCTRLTMCQDGLADVAATADAVAVATPATASAAAATPAAAARAVRPRRRCRGLSSSPAQASSPVALPDM